MLLYLWLFKDRRNRKDSKMVFKDLEGNDCDYTLVEIVYRRYTLVYTSMCTLPSSTNLCTLSTQKCGHYIKPHELFTSNN